MKKSPKTRIVLAKETLRNLEPSDLRDAAGMTFGPPGSCAESCVTQVDCPTYRLTACVPTACTPTACVAC